jgi:hypothetical protein
LPAMDFDEHLWRYRQNAFTDDDITRCTGLTVRAWRELIKLRAVHTVAEPRGRGRVRLCDATVLKRAAVIGALNQAGLSLAVSGQIALYVPFHSVLYEIVDPIRILFRSMAEANSEITVHQPRVDWFNANEPAQADPHSDWLVHIYDNRFVGIRYQAEDEPAIFGDLREERTSFVAWLPLHPRSQFARCAIAELASERLPSPSRWVDFVADWEDPGKRPKELWELGYRFEKHADGDPPRLAAEISARSPVTLTTINISLAMRKALRRFLGLEPATSAPTPSAST